MDLMWLIWVLKILLFFIFDTAAHLTVVKQGDSVTLACTDSPTIYPHWSGPDNTIYNYVGLSTLYPYLGEKSSRLSWYSDNNKSLIISNVMKNDSGTYICSYIIESTIMIITHTLSVRVLPQQPVISNAETLDGTRSVVRGTEGQVLTLQCTSTGGYPEPLLYWFKDNTQTQPLDTTKTSQEGSDGTFMVEVTHTFTPSNQDDDVTFVCQSSFSPPLPSQQTVQVQLLLNLKPPPPVVTSYPVVEGVSGKVVDCRTSGFRPDNIDVWLQMNGNNLTSNPSVTGGTGQTFSAVASYRETLQRQQNGKPLVCHVAHQTLQTPLTGRGTADVRFRPLTAALTGTVSNIVVESDAKITLTCTSGSSNPKSTITWYKNGVQIPNPASVIESTGDYSGVVTSQIYEFVPDRSMDGERVYCTVHNSIEGQPPVRRKTKTLDLLYKQPENQNNTGAIVGGTVGASVLVLGGVVFFVIWVKYLRQRTSKAPGTGSSNLAVERTDNSTENNASGIRLDLDGHKDVYYNIERNVYDELQERSGDTHEYEAIDRQRQIETSDPKNKEYDNLQLR